MFSEELYAWLVFYQTPNKASYVTGFTIKNLAKKNYSVHLVTIG